MIHTTKTIFIALLLFIAIAPTAIAQETADCTTCKDLTWEQCFLCPTCFGSYGSSGSGANGHYTDDESYSGCLEMTANMLAKKKRDYYECTTSKGTWNIDEFNKPGSCQCPPGKTFKPGYGCTKYNSTPKPIELGEEFEADTNNLWLTNSITNYWENYMSD